MVVQQPMFKIGDHVRRTLPWDGTLRGGLPTGPVLTIVKVYPADSFTIYQLPDGKTEFEFNLLKADAANNQKIAS